MHAGMSNVASAQSIHVLVVADTADPRIGKACAQTIERIEHVFATLIPSDRYSMRVLDSARERYDEDRIIAAISRVPVRGDDTFVFMYDGHGAQEGGRHFLHMPGRG